MQCLVTSDGQADILFPMLHVLIGELRCEERTVTLAVAEKVSDRLRQICRE